LGTLQVFLRTVNIGIIWSFLYFKGLEELLLNNWRFHLFRQRDWMFLYNIWLGGWVIDTAREIAFVSILLFFVPLWFTGWAALGSISWIPLVKFILTLPLRLFRMIIPKKILPASKLKVKRRKSYKQTRPRQIRPPSIAVKSSAKAEEKAVEDKPKKKKKKKKQAKAENKPATPAPSKASAIMEDDFDDEFSDSFDDEDDDFAPEPVPAPRSEPAPAAKATSGGGENLEAIISEKGYGCIKDINIKDQKIDFVALSSDEVSLCLVDSEEGDWLADEERFNDEEPLWFSESSHRISPVRQVLDAKEALEAALNDAGMMLKVRAYVVINRGTIINAEDMLDIWDDLNVVVARIGKGEPEELGKFNIVLPICSSPVGDGIKDKIKNIISDMW